MERRHYHASSGGAQDIFAQAHWRIGRCLPVTASQFDVALSDDRTGSEA